MSTVIHNVMFNLKKKFIQEYLLARRKFSFTISAIVEALQIVAGFVAYAVHE